MEETYRRELVHGCSEAGDDAVYRRGMAEACACWVAETLSWSLESALRQDETWGSGTQRQRHLHRLEVLVGALEETGHLPALHATTRALARCLRERWPEAEMPLYPAFR
jgi:hypothetical protein